LEHYISEYQIANIMTNALVRYSSISLSPTLGRNEKVKQRIRKKTRKPNAFKVLGWSWYHSLIWVWLSSHSCLSPRCLPPRILQQVVSEPWVQWPCIQVCERC